ncbi:DUF2993 domain-containing protein [Spirulina subsalsa FACHB-351]|uniref:DUF2993 domain-containing protein n=1 Tax=Spirulina subsalsa FACHB-351 TaxID=234711 RepID=A0ABT3L9Y5_9CYAN|nr:DUF2993 domain-containing protein [Spirulina subsalsa]MCW6038326.1 DUF2993 domain-containing protein [Spirulina subsalsa FACHB-351]
MEWIVILLTGLLSGATPTGFIVESVVESNLRSRLAGVDTLAVRIDNTPSHQLLRGKVDRVRLASRGVYLTPDLRLDTLELETDPLNVDLQQLRQGGSNWRDALRQPLQGAVRLVLTEADLKQALQSPALRDRLQSIVTNLARNLPSTTPQQYQLSDLNLEFLGDNRLRLQLQARSFDTTGEDSAELTLDITGQLIVEEGRRIQFSEATILLNDNPLPPMFANIALSTLNSRLDLDSLTQQGITARLLQLDIDDERLSIAAFVRVE